MPLLRHECSVCKVELVDLYGLTDPTPMHCDEPMRLLMPRRVVGRVKPDSNGVHTGSGFARSQTIEVDGQQAQVIGNPDDYPAHVPESRVVSTPIDPTDERALPAAPSTGVFAKDYEQCSADERDARWHDGAQALAAWTAKQLEAKGEAPTAARDQATEVAQQTITKARAESTRADGLT